MKKVGFLFLDSIAHIYHMAPTAFQLSLNPSFDVHLYIATKENLAVLNELKALFPSQRAHLHFIRATPLQRCLQVLKNRSLPKASSLLKNNFKELASCDLLVTPDKNLSYIFDRQPPHLKTLCVHHGSGYRDYVLSKEFARFDRIQVCGVAAYKTMKGSRLFQDHQLAIVGYPKFDVALKTPKKKFFNNDRPIVLYNPHDNPSLSSWYEWGVRVLDYFVKNKEFNLIFAPHIQLCANRKVKIPLKYDQEPNIIIDRGSKACCDMSYTMGADIYLGDVSSQYDEFLFKPRPCIFLNPHGLEWRGDPQYDAWHLGSVIEKGDFGNFERVLKGCMEKQVEFEAGQKEYFKRVFSLAGELSQKRAADDIESLF